MRIGLKKKRRREKEEEENEEERKKRRKEEGRQTLEEMGVDSLTVGKVKFRRIKSKKDGTGVG